MTSPEGRGTFCIEFRTVRLRERTTPSASNVTSILRPPDLRTSPSARPVRRSTSTRGRTSPSPRSDTPSRYDRRRRVNIATTSNRQTVTISRSTGLPSSFDDTRTVLFACFIFESYYSSLCYRSLDLHCSESAFVVCYRNRPTYAFCICPLCIVIVCYPVRDVIFVWSILESISSPILAL